MKHEYVRYIRNYPDFPSNRQREILQALACSAESLANTLSTDEDPHVRLYYQPLIRSVDENLRDAFEELSK
jgi:hypothetical protein